MQTAVEQRTISPSAAQARIIVDELIGGGVRDAVLCPGSRSAPLSYALFAAAGSGAIRLHVRVDERTAGFLAIGLASASERVVPVVTTSGTAVANLHPAVCEADHAGVPLLVLSANRPYEAVGTGESQTIDQLGIFGARTRATIALAIAEPGRDQERMWRAAVCRALAAAAGRRTVDPGPVQLDVPLREPLVPNDEPNTGHGPRFGQSSWTKVACASVDAPIAVDVAADTIVVAGHGSGEHPELADMPTIAEPTAPMHGRPVHPLALHVLQPRQAIVTGRPTLHRNVRRLLADPAVSVHTLAQGPYWADASGSARSCGTRVMVNGRPAEKWLDDCRAATEMAVSAVRDRVAVHPKPTGLHVARAVMDALCDGDQLVVGASNSIRNISFVGYPRRGVSVLSNRGVAGIDGTVSTAIGAALGHSGRTIALMGDLTFVHDASGLLIGPEEPRPADLTIVVANDDGGGIFELLEYGQPRYAAAFERVFGTPHGADIGALCAAYGTSHQTIDATKLGAALRDRTDGLRVIEVETDRGSIRELHESIVAGLTQSWRS